MTLIRSRGEAAITRQAAASCIYDDPTGARIQPKLMAERHTLSAVTGRTPVALLIDFEYNQG